MPKNLKDRIYLDYNSTSPFSKRLISYLGKGDFPFANPSSMHASGKASRKFINETASFLHQVFGLPDSEYNLIFNSGSTESIKTFFGAAKEGDGVFYCESDHAAVISTMNQLRQKGVYCEALAIDQNGNLLIEQAIEKINSFAEESGKSVFLNYLVLHNETGVYWPLGDAAKIKAKTGAKVHVDATQLPGKVAGWKDLNPGLDAYTFSGHKFGAMKGVGFSFVNKSFDYTPLLQGGGQQGGVRGGTENTLGVYSLKLALEEMLELDLDKLEALRDAIESVVEGREDTIVFGKKAVHGRGVNTLNFALANKKADISLIQFDMAGLEVSSGSACSAGSVEPSATLMEMGMGRYAKNGIRISLGPGSLDRKDEILTRVASVISKL